VSNSDSGSRSDSGSGFAVQPWQQEHLGLRLQEKYLHLQKAGPTPAAGIEPFRQSLQDTQLA